MTNPAEQLKRRRRLVVIERLMLNGLGASAIHDMIQEDFPVAEGTVRNDIVAINKAHKEALDEATEMKGKAEFLARTLNLRARADSANELRLAHDLDKDIAKAHGVTFKEDPRQIQLSVESARNEMDKVMQAVFTIVTDPDVQELIIKAIEDLASDTLQIAPAE